MVRTEEETFHERSPPGIAIFSQQIIRVSHAVPFDLPFPVSLLKRVYDAVLEAGGVEMSLTNFGTTL